MVAPNRHINTLTSLVPEEQSELMIMARRSEMALTEAYHPHGINVGINLGKAAGAGIEDHLHVHLVPRWAGDTNFMTAVAETRVLPEALQQTAERLRPIFERLAKNWCVSHEGRHELHGSDRGSRHRRLASLRSRRPSSVRGWSRGASGG